MTESTATQSGADAASPELAALAGDDLPPVSLRQLIDAGVHFGHQTNRWNPKMAPYIYGARNGIHIIDLDQTVRLFRRALEFVTHTVARGGQILFVGTKRQAQEVVIEEASRSGQFHVTGRWLGGTLTNYRTMKVGIDRLGVAARTREHSGDHLRRKPANGVANALVGKLRQSVVGQPVEAGRSLRVCRLGQHRVGGCRARRQLALDSELFDEALAVF